MKAQRIDLAAGGQVSVRIVAQRVILKAHPARPRTRVAVVSPEEAYEIADALLRCYDELVGI